MKARNVLIAVFSFFYLYVLRDSARAQGTAFTYQGQLTASGVAANGNYDFTFGLYTNVSTGSQIGSTETNLAVAVSNGLFTTTLNFSNAFNGTAYWLGIGVRSNGTASAFATLNPRQAINPTPYAITASNLTGSIQGAQITSSIPASVVSGTFSNSVSFTNSTNVFAGNGSGLTNVPSVTQSNLLYAYDTNIQYVVTAGTWQLITFASTTVDGWGVPASGEFTAGQTGTYLIQYQAHFANSYESSYEIASIRAMLNLSTEIPGSECIAFVPSGLVQTVSRSFVVSMTAGQVFSLQMTASLADDVELYSSTFYGQLFPSVALTIVRIQ
jgi:hypothetical protein